MKKFSLTGKVLSVYIGISDKTISKEQDKLLLDWDGIREDRHYGRIKFAGVREEYMHKGEEMLNLRQISIVSKEELNVIAENLKIDHIEAEDLGANILIEGIKNFTEIPFGSVMKFKYGTVLLLTGDNFPCILPGKELSKREENHLIASQFAKKAMHLRGQTALILKSGIIKRNDNIEIVIPKEVQTGLNYNF